MSNLNYKDDSWHIVIPLIIGFSVIGLFIGFIVGAALYPLPSWNKILLDEIKFNNLSYKGMEHLDYDQLDFELRHDPSVSNQTYNQIISNVNTNYKLQSTEPRFYFFMFALIGAALPPIIIFSALGLSELLDRTASKRYLCSKCNNWFRSDDKYEPECPFCHRHIRMN